MKITYIMTITALSLLSVGCGGSFSTAEGDDSESSGGGSSHKSGGSSGEDEDSGDGDDGSGGTVSTGTGGDRTGGGDTCIPKTCDEVTFELTGTVVEDGATGSACGGFDNGCNGILTCGCSNPEACGANTPNRITSPGGQKYNLGVENVCGGGCVKHGTLVTESECGFEQSAYTCIFESEVEENGLDCPFSTGVSNYCCND